MATAICDQDGGHEVKWYAGRGHKLADERCPDHGTPLHGRKRTTAAPRAGQRACVVCGRRRVPGAPTNTIAEEAFRAAARRIYLYRNLTFRVESAGPHRAGDLVCIDHPTTTICGAISERGKLPCTDQPGHSWPHRHDCPTAPCEIHRPKARRPRILTAEENAAELAATTAPATPR